MTPRKSSSDAPFRHGATQVGATRREETRHQLALDGKARAAASAAERDAHRGDDANLASAEQAELTDEQSEQLEALGYLSDGFAVGDTDP